MTLEMYTGVYLISYAGPDSIPRLSCENYTSYGNYKYVLDNGLKYGGLIDLLEDMVKELPIYANTFVDYIKDKGQ